MSNELVTTDPNLDHLEEETTEQDILPKGHKGLYRMGTPLGHSGKIDDAMLDRFLMNYALTGRKYSSAEAAGFSASALNAIERQDEEFAERVQMAKQMHLEGLERELHRRAVEGVLEPIVAGKDPQIVTYVRKYSDKLLELALRKADPVGYGNRDANVSVNVNTGVLVAPTATTEEGSILTIEDVDDS